MLLVNDSRFTVGVGECPHGKKKWKPKGVPEGVHLFQ